MPSNICKEYLKRTNFPEYKFPQISQILTKFAKLNIRGFHEKQL